MKIKNKIFVIPIKARSKWESYFTDESNKTEGFLR